MEGVVAGTGRSYFRRVDGVDVGLNASSFSADVGYFFVHNKNFDRPYTEFGGWKGLSHGGFLPTGETAVFLLAGDRVERRLEVVRLFREEHWFHMYHVVGLEGAGNGEPFLSGQLRISEDFLYRLSFEENISRTIIWVFRPNGLVRL